MSREYAQRDRAGNHDRLFRQWTPNDSGNLRTAPFP